LKLLYRGSRDGFGGQTILDKVVGKKEKVIVVKDTKDYVFGGYTNV
jgi:hypothetical protein